MKHESIEVTVSRPESRLGLATETIGWSCARCGALYVNAEACRNHEERCNA